MAADASNVVAIGGRAPPSNLDAESYVLSEILGNSARFDEVADMLRPEHFYSESHRQIYTAVCNLAVRGDAIDHVAVATELRALGKLQAIGGTPYLLQLIQTTPHALHLGPHAQSILDCWRIRQTIAICQTTAAVGYTEDPLGDTSGYIEQAERQLAELAHIGSKRALRPVAEIMADQIGVMADARARGARLVGLSTEIPQLDAKTGGFMDGDLYVIAGRPGIGKTAFITSLALSATKAPSVTELPSACAFFSLEMPAEQMALRATCAVGSVDISRARMYDLTNQQWSQLIAAAQKLGSCPLHIDDTPAITILELRARIRRLRREIETGRSKPAAARLGLVVVDYLQLMKGVRERGDSREREISSLSQGLKNLAKEERVPVVALSQLNRAPETRGRTDKRPQLSDLRESGSIEQDSDSVWFIYREGYYDKSVSPEAGEVIIAKQRNGPTGTIHVKFQGEYGRFVPQAGDEYGFDEMHDDFQEGI